MKNFIIKNKFLRYVLVLIFWIVVWQAFYMAIHQDILLASPLMVLKRVISFSTEPYFWESIFFSLIRVVIGFVAASVVGTVLAALMSFSSMAYTIFKPLILIIKTTPVASFAVLMLVFIKSVYLPSFISFLMVMPVIWSNVFEGIKKTDEKLLQMAAVYDVPISVKIAKIYVPSVKPYFLSATQTGIGFAWKSAIAAEVIANTYLSIGSQLLNAKIYMETQDVFAWTAVIIVLSFSLEKIIIKGLHILWR